MMEKYSFGTGRRKSAIAQIRISKGTGNIIRSDGNQPEVNITNAAKDILKIISSENKFDISIIVKGGGIKSQSDATKLAIARALSKIDPSFEKTMKKEGFLTRDSREKERKKPGLKSARRAPQWQKR